MIERPTARLLAFDQKKRLLLFRCNNPSSPGECFWIAPGGGVESGETYESAARRELWEETGITSSADVGPCVLEDKKIGHHTDFGGREITFCDRYFPVRLSADEITHLDPALVSSAGYLEFRWWPAAEMATTNESIWPEGLPALVQRILDDENIH